MNDQDLLEKLNSIEKETRRIRRLFGISIIILALLLMVLAPSIIRIAWVYSDSPVSDVPPSMMSGTHAENGTGMAAVEHAATTSMATSSAP